MSGDEFARGEVQADADGVLTVPGLKVTAKPSTLTIAN